jgi:hypothetical protein
VLHGLRIDRALDIPYGRSFYSKNEDAPDDIRLGPIHKHMTARRR